MKVIALASWAEHFGGLEDSRQAGKVEYAMLSLIAIATMSAICGLFEWEEIEQWAEHNQEWLASFLPLPEDSRTPSASTFERLFARLKPKPFSVAFLDWTKSLIHPAERPHLAIDGKALRHAFSKAAERSMFYMVTAFCTDNQVVLGQLRTEDKSNEIAAIPVLLETLDLRGTIVTIDAAGTQVQNAVIIHDAGGDYVLPLKENQPKTHSEVAQFFCDAESEGWPNVEHPEVVTHDKQHGRIEQRTVTAIEAPIEMVTMDKWKGVRSLVRVQRERAVKNGKTSSETTFYICTLAHTDVEFIARTIRKHWSIENQQHWSLDVAFREDESTINRPYAAENMATLRRFSLGLHKLNTLSKRSLRKKAFQCLLNSDDLVSTLFPAIS